MKSMSLIGGNVHAAILPPGGIFYYSSCSSSLSGSEFPDLSIEPTSFINLTGNRLTGIQ